MLERTFWSCRWKFKQSVGATHLTCNKCLKIYTVLFHKVTLGWGLIKFWIYGWFCRSKIGITLNSFHSTTMFQLVSMTTLLPPMRYYESLGDKTAWFMSPIYIVMGIGDGVERRRDVRPQFEPWWSWHACFSEHGTNGWLRLWFHKLYFSSKVGSVS